MTTAALYTVLHTDYRTVHLQRLVALRQKSPALAQLADGYSYQLLLSHPAQADLYVCGLKPYAEAGQTHAPPVSRPTIGYSAYLDETWSTLYVKRALRLIEIIQQHLLHTKPNPRDVLITNWFFQRAEDARQLRAFGLRQKEMQPYHELLLQHYRPQVMLCIGNGEQFSAFAGMRDLHAPVTGSATVPYLERSRLRACSGFNNLRQNGPFSSYLRCLNPHLALLNSGSHALIC